MSVEENIENICKKIFDAADKSGNKPQDITIVCISKNRSLQEIYQVLEKGINHIGENRIQEAQEKHLALVKYAKEKNIPLNFHMVGHLQTNKVNKVLDMFDLIQSVDSLMLAKKINEASKGREVNTEILIEVKTSREESKFGIEEKKVIILLHQLCKLNNICVRGLMTMAPFDTNREKARPYFRRLRQLRDRINEISEPLFKQKIKMDFLSMGMSQDYEVAVEEGANMLRIGTAIFK